MTLPTSFKGTTTSWVERRQQKIIKKKRNFSVRSIVYRISDMQGPLFNDMSSFFPSEIDDAIQYINLGYGAQDPKIVIL